MKKSEWHTFYDGELGTFKIEFFRSRAFLHLSFKKPLDGMRKVKAMFPSLKKILKNLGYDRINVLIPEGNESLYRFERHFGFEEKRRLQGQILMEQEI